MEPRRKHDGGSGAVGLLVVAAFGFLFLPARMVRAELVSRRSGPRFVGIARPRALLPDGTEFKTWEPSQLHFTKTLYVDQRHPRASNDGPGTCDRPLKTIQRAAQLLRPGERVVIASGVYREWVCPARGGTDPGHIISYEAAPGANVVLTGSEILRVKWEESLPWVPDPPPGSPPKPSQARIYMARLPRELFAGYNPFAICNYPQVDEIPTGTCRNCSASRSPSSSSRSGDWFSRMGAACDGVSRYSELADSEGVFWTETSGLVIHATPYGNVDPDSAQWEITTREQIFAPEQLYLGYLRLKGLTLEYAGNGFPFPNGKISATHGHHWILEGNTIRWANGVGVDLVSGGDFTYAPARGIVGPPHRAAKHDHRLRNQWRLWPGAYGTLIEDNLFCRNCWHDAEELAECAAIKTHQNHGVLVQAT